MALEGLSPLSRLRMRIWPIQGYELKKVLPLLFMKFLISFTYGVLTTMKDAFVVTAKGSGAEVIPVLKGWVVLPIALLATLGYSKLSNLFRRSTLFYLVVLFFCRVFPSLRLLLVSQLGDPIARKLGRLARLSIRRAESTLGCSLSKLDSVPIFLS